MAESKMITGIHGYFDVKEYSSKPREQRAIKGNDQVIRFGVRFNQLPEQFRDYANAFTDKNGNQAYYVEFKIGANCKWFDAAATPTLRPDNTYLDGKQFEVSIQYVQLNGDPALKQARGYWANAIMYKEVETNPFASMVAPQQEDAAPSAPAAPMQQEAQASQQAAGWEVGMQAQAAADAQMAAAQAAANQMGDQFDIPF